MNMMRTVTYGILFFLLIVLVSDAQEIIDNPVSDFLNFLRAPDDSELLRLDADINSDGQKEVFLSRTDARNAKAGFIWTVYLPVEGGYKRWRKPICFRTDALFIGECEQFDGPALVTYWPGGCGTGALIAFQIRDNKIEETVLHVDPGRREEGRKIYDSIFEENEPPKIEKRPISALAHLIDVPATGNSSKAAERVQASAPANEKTSHNARGSSVLIPIAAVALIIVGSGLYLLRRK